MESDSLKPCRVRRSLEDVLMESHIVGYILGTAVGDAIGLPYEGVSRTRSPRLLGPPDRHRFLFRRGMVSDDTEHTCMVAQSLIASGADVEEFTRQFARRLKWWFLALPAGIGLATLRSSIKLCFGVSPKSSGVFSAGNGPAMRAAIFGATFDDVDRMVEFVRASSRVTHSDPKAEYGAIAVALAAHCACRNPQISASVFVDQVSEILGAAGCEFLELLRSVAESVSEQQSTQDFAAQMGLTRGVSGYVYHTVPVAIHAWLSSPQDYRRAVMSVIECGGDADTTAAIVGGIVGTAVGERGIPPEWLQGLCDYPRTIDWMRRLAGQLAESIDAGSGGAPLRLNTVAVLLRNVFFVVVVLFHGFRRLLPPY